MMMQNHKLFMPIISNGIKLLVGVQIESNIVERSIYLKPNTHAQVGIRWDEPNWERLDTGVPTIRGKGCTVGIGTRACPEQYRLYPEWVSSQPKPEYYQAYVDFILEICGRYNPDYVEIWNEPDVDHDYLAPNIWWMGAWGNETDEYYGGRAYGDLLALLYPQVKATYRDIRIVAGALLLPYAGISQNQDKFIEGAIVAGGQFDAVSYHNYVLYPDTRWSRHIDKALYLRSLTDKSIIMTETALRCVNDCDEAFRSAQAEYYKHVYDSMVAGFDIVLDGFLWYSLANNGWDHTDLVENDVKMPVWYKYEELA